MVLRTERPYEHDRHEELANQREEERDDTHEHLFRGLQEPRIFVPVIKSALINLPPNKATGMYSKLQNGATGAVGEDANYASAAMIAFVRKGAKTSPDLALAEGEVTGPLITNQPHTHQIHRYESIYSFAHAVPCYRRGRTP
ncbi:hypothetical protein B0H19DRAFT_1064321 [Mycena capillaripes]|nr:hypothetical protein B0H19DRAFT_1064321 [Mycena capillaripes]